MNKLIENFINNLTKEDLIKYAKGQNLKFSEKEIDFAYNFVKSNYKKILNNPKNFDLSIYKDKFSPENFNFLTGLYNRYKYYLIK